MRHRDVNVADRNRNPLHEMDVLPGKAAVEIRFNRLLEEFLTYQIRMALADDLVRRHLPVALVDRIDPLKTVIPTEHRHGLLRALEHLIRYVFRSLALGLVLSAFVDIQADAQKVDHATLVVSEWVRVRQEPPIFAVGAAGDRSMEPTQALSGLRCHVSHSSTSRWPVSTAFCTFDLPPSVVPVVA